MKESISSVVVCTLFLLLTIAAAPANAQDLRESARSRALPSNPQPTGLTPNAEPTFAATGLVAPLPQSPGTQPNNSSNRQITPAPPAAGTPIRLTR